MRVVWQNPFFVFAVCMTASGPSWPTAELPIETGPFPQHIHAGYSENDGLPQEAITRLAFDARGTLHARTDTGEVFVFDGDNWSSANARRNPTKELFKPTPWYQTLEPVLGTVESVRDIAQHAGEIAVAAENGLFLGDGVDWEMALPVQGDERWAPIDVRAVTYDTQGRLWFASPQGVGCRATKGDWRLFTGADGLPYNDFTCMAAGSTGVWFGTTNGAIRFHQGEWSFRQGRRWLLDNHVRDIAVDGDGRAWTATAAGVSCIADQAMTLARKAAFYEAEIEQYHRRTRFGYVNPALLAVAGDKSTATPVYTDNDGFNTGLYLSAMSFAYAVTGESKYREYADNAFRALAFLSEITQGGQHPAPEGFIARNVIPTSDPDPNEIYDREYDIRRNKADSLWKIIQPRLPVDATGDWYWKCDSSSDELDGHFLGYAIYFDRVCQTKEQKDAVRKVVTKIIEHILAHDFSLVDHDGLPTRWAHFSPNDLNRNDAWVAERGLNSYSILTYLSIAHHITDDPKYREVYLELALDHGYAMNGMSQPKALEGPRDPGHQPDDNMAFINYYHLIRYETDPKLLNMYYYAIQNHWRYERLERNAFTNFIYAACVRGKTRRDQWRKEDLSPPIECYEDAIDTLERYPLDLIEWPMSNAHRTDLMPLGEHWGEAPIIGGRIDGYAFPIDERHETYWDWNPWSLTFEGNGTRLRPGFHYLLAYYLGRHHGFIGE